MDGETFRTLRRKLRKTQIELADELNRHCRQTCDRAMMSRWESGRDPIPGDVANAMEAW